MRDTTKLWCDKRMYARRSSNERLEQVSYVAFALKLSDDHGHRWGGTVDLILILSGDTLQHIVHTGQRHIDVDHRTQSGWYGGESSGLSALMQGRRLA
jgi:hypothetical protein